MFTALAVCCCTRGARSEIRTWNGADGADFYAPAQWAPAGAPSPSDELVINAGRPVTSSLTTVRVSDGGSITVSGPSAALGQPRNPASWLAPQVKIGETGQGRVLVRDGATLSTMATDLGVQPGSRGEVTIQGSGSTWAINATHFRIGAGAGGEGVLNLVDHASMNYFSEVSVAYGAQSTGAVVVDNASFTAPVFKVGDGGSAALTVRNGGTVSADNSFVGYYSGSPARLDVEGEGSTLASGVVLVVGRFGTADVFIADGGAITTGGNFFLGDQTGHGAVSLVGGGSRVDAAGSVTVGSASAAGASGELALAPGTSVTAGQALRLSEASELSFVADESGPGLVSAARDAALGGTLRFDFAPGYLPPAGTTFDLITAGGGVSGQFTRFVTDEPVRLVYGADTVSVQVVPEPAVAPALVALALLGLRFGRASAARSRPRR
jgi:T5SS/PEP-CTERM-associated repeat protein